MSLNEKTQMDYTIDGKPVTWKQLIEAADEHGRFRDPQFKTTREAAQILRANGYTVERAAQ
jgi:hypothetical protein